MKRIVFFRNEKAEEKEVSHVEYANHGATATFLRCVNCWAKLLTIFLIYEIFPSMSTVMIENSALLAAKLWV